jgi:hypothetical protein
MIDKNQILWDEKNLTELQNNCENKSEKEISDTTKDIKINSTQVDWRDITDPELRKKMYKKAWRELNKHKNKYYNEIYKDKQKTWREKNKEIIKQKKKAYYQANKAKINAKNILWAKNNKEKILNCKNKNVEKIRARRNKYNKFKRETDIQYKLSSILRRRLSKIIKRKTKIGSAVKDLGCTISELKKHLESKFQDGMTWENHGSTGWHIDHIKPLSSFDLSNRKQFLQACHYTNLQPLWAKDNLSKSDKV